MGQAFDRRRERAWRSVRGHEARRSFDALMQDHADAAEIRIRSLKVEPDTPQGASAGNAALHMPQGSVGAQDRQDRA